MMRRPVTLFLNAARIDYDHRMDLSRLQQLTHLIRHNVDYMTDPDEIINAFPKSNPPEIVITKEMEITREVFAKFPSSVKLICEAGTGFNNLPIQDCRARGVMVCNIPTYSTEAVAHMVITFMMNFSCSFQQQQKRLFAGDKSNFYGPFQFPLIELKEKTIGLIGGTGKIGSKVAEISLALGMKVLISSRSDELPSDHVLSGNERVRVVSSIEQLMRESDFVSVHCPLNKQTRESIDGNLIRLMKPSAFLINTARGAIINEKELIQCMKENVIAGAGLDVQHPEPPSEDSDLWELDNVILTPHIGWRKLETRQRVIDMVADNIEAYIEGSPQYVVN